MFSGDTYCLFRSGIRFCDCVGDALAKAAHKMCKQGKESMNIKGDHFEGVVTTNFGFAMMGSLGGVKFHASVDTLRGSGEVTFIITDPSKEIRDDEVPLMTPWHYNGELGRAN